MELSQPFIKIDFRKVVLAVILLVFGIALFALTDAWTVARVMLGATIFWFLVKRPELALAIQFNGFSLYLYTLYKLKVEPETVTTATYYSVLAAAYLIGGFHLAKKRRQFRFNRIDLMFCVLYVLFYLSYLLFSTDNPAATRKISYAPLLVIVPYLGVQLLSSREQVRRFLTYVAWLAVLLMVPSFYELLVNPLYREYGRFSAYFFTNASQSDNPIQFGIANALLLIVILFRLSQQHWVGKLELLLIIPSIYLMLRSGARGPVISFLVMLFFYIAWLGWVRWRIKAAIFVTLLLLLVTAYRFIPETTASFYQDLLNPDVRPTEVNSIQERIVLIDIATREFFEYPLFGVGTGNSSGGTGYPHNVLIEVAAEFGIIGLLIFGLLCYFVVTTAWKYLRGSLTTDDDWLMNLVFSIFIFAFVEALFSAYMGGDTLFYGSMGLVSVVAKLTESEKALSERAAAYLRERAIAISRINGLTGQVAEIPSDPTA